jgi:hypothetical protein
MDCPVKSKLTTAGNIVFVVVTILVMVLAVTYALARPLLESLALIKWLAGP